LNDYLISLILGIVEGLTEFIPVSSTAHLRIAEFLLHINLSDGYWKMYTIVIQLGAILCVPIYFRERIAKFIGYTRGDTPIILIPFKIVKCLFISIFRSRPVQNTLIAFVVTAIPAFLLTKMIGEHLENLYIMGMSLLVGGIVMWFIDAMNSPSEKAGPEAPYSRIRTWHMEDMSFGQAIWIGACQILSAVFPGTSRSMSTIAGGQVAGMSRAAALEFSFFLSIPTMFVATAYAALKSARGKGVENPIGVSQIDAHGWIILGIGFVVSFIVAYASVAWFMNWVRNRGFAPFAIYRITLGAAVLYWAAHVAM
jgi:undecaprenyl-diphosphatase